MPTLKRLVAWEQELAEMLLHQDWDFYSYQSIDSTMDQARRLIPNKLRKNLLVMTCNQEQGRGRLGRVWKATEGSLAVTYVLPLPSEIDLGPISLVAGLLLYDFLPHEQHSFYLKWPNDLILGDGRKIAGILCETYQIEKKRYLAIGIGVNLIQNTEDHHSVSLYELTSISYHPCEIARKLASALEQALGDYLDSGCDYFRSRWEDASFKFGTEVEVKIGNEIGSAIYQGLNSRGEIILQFKDRMQAFSSVEINKIRYVGS